MEEPSTVPDPQSPSAPSVPAVPPTPPVALSALLAREDLGLRQIAGPAGPGTVIRWAHTSEMSDPYPYLLGGELLLTAGVHVPQPPAGPDGTTRTGDAGSLRGYFDAYVSRIVAAGGAALGFGLAPVHDRVPPALVAACDAHGLPLLEVPPRTTFSGVARAVWQLMAQARLAELRRVTEAQQSLAAAAARPEPVPAVLRQLAQRVGGLAVLYGPEGTELARTGRIPDPSSTEGISGRGATRSTSPAGSAATATGNPAATPASSPGSRPSASASTRANPLHAGGPAAGSADARLTVTPPEAALAELAGVVRPAAGPGGAAPVPSPTPSSATDTVGGVHLAAYALGSGQGFVLGVAAPRRDPGDHTIASVASVLLSLLTGEQQSGSGAARSAALVRMLLGAAPEAVAPLLGGGRWTVVHACRSSEGPAPDAVTATALGAALGTALVDVDGDVVRVLVPGDRAPAEQPGWTCGVSAPAGPDAWASADTQAARALARARATRTALVRHGDRPALADLLAAGDAEAHALALLAPIAGTPALTETLRSWLSLHGSWDRTAVALAVHRNTVRQRIARCSALLGADLDDPDVRMELWFALRAG
ncbi:helix-turn-helix domain-containing protein [Streptomyces sp. NPDC006173]|uniref:helix-turn-helix domain-containing protein n=1 Tax=Streptomyces sp. NPDC006173 TaxID=3155349 RepID=UPI0033F368A3